MVRPTGLGSEVQGSSLFGSFSTYYKMKKYEENNHFENGTRSGMGWKRE